MTQFSTRLSTIAMEDSNNTYTWLGCNCYFEDFFVEKFNKLTYKSMRGFDVEDAFKVAGVDELLVIFMHLHSKFCIAQHHHLHELIDTHFCIIVSYKLHDVLFP